MTEGKLVDLAAAVTPVGQGGVDQGDEAFVVSGFAEVGRFVDYDVFEVFFGFAGEVGVESDGGGGSAAAAPFRLHALDKEALDSHSDERLPFRDEFGCGGFELGAVPVFEGGLFLFGV